MELIYTIFAIWFASTLVGTVTLVKAVMEACNAVRVMEDINDSQVANYCKHVVTKLKEDGTPLTWTAWKNKLN